MILIYLTKKKKIAQRLCLLHAVFFIELLFDPEDRDDIFLRIVGYLSPGYTALYPRRYNCPYSPL
jgi:hypothetical protein